MTMSDHAAYARLAAPYCQLCLPKSLSDIGWVRISEWTNVDYNHCGKMPGFAGERT
jgi:hypothetical protein